jgi:hypothetical protein
MRPVGSEDPWLCVPNFGLVCLYRRLDFPPKVTDVNSGMYLTSGKGHQQTFSSILPQRRLPGVKRPLA